MSFRRRMRSLPITSVKVDDPFWTPRQQALVTTTLPLQFEQLQQTGRLENFVRAAAGAGEFQGEFWFDDSDVYKWAEATAYGLAGRDSKSLRDQLNQVIELIAAAQEPSGYLNTFFQLKHPDLKWRNLHTMHEMYCGGHLIEAGVALFEAIEDRRLLDVAIKFADHVMTVFGPDKQHGYCGHQEIELALQRLALATENEKYASFAAWMIESRGHRPSPFEAEFNDPESMALTPWVQKMLSKDGKYIGEYCQDHLPIRDQSEVVGHAVRAMYFYIAAAEMADGREDLALETALERAWTNLTSRRMYVTGGIGPSATNEGFTSDHDLPNLTAYAETCAAIGLVFWGHSMLEMTGNSDYADVMERALLNGVVSGISLAGDAYFYTNPLESRGNHQRVPWFGCACCPPNIARLIGNVAHYSIGESEDTFYIHLPIGMEAESKFGKIAISRKSAFSGTYEVRVNVEKPTEFAIAVRIPAWADHLTSDLPGSEEEAEYESGYAIYRRVWSPGDVLTIELEMEPKWLVSDPRVRDNLGRVSLSYGPYIYCLEEADTAFTPQLFAVDVDAEPELAEESILGGVTSISFSGARESDDFAGELYAELGSVDYEEAIAKFIPYYAWNNRGAGGMQVWVRSL